MDYNELPNHIRQYIRQDLFDASPENVRPFLVMMAEDQVRRNDHNITYISSDDPGKSYDTLYTHQELPPHMNIISHIFTLRPNHDEPSRTQFINVIRNNLRILSGMVHHRVRNISVRYDISNNTVQWFSFSRTNVESMGLERLLEHMVIGQDEWGEDFYGGSDYVRNYFHSRSLNFTQFFIVTELIQGGMCEVEYNYYKCMEVGQDCDNDCLIDCFRYLSNTHMEPNKVRHLLKVSNNEMLTLKHIAMLEAIFKVDVCVYEDRRAIGYSYKSGKHYYDHQAIIKRDYPITLYGDLNSPNKILWKDNHFSIIVEEYMARHCHCEHTGIFVGYGKKLTKEEIIKELHRQGRIDTDESTIADDDKITYYYFFDYETIYDPITMELMPYAWSIVKYDNEGNNMAVWSEVASSPMGMKPISNVLMAEAPRFNERKYLIGYNNSRFDNYFLLRECQAKNIHVSNVYFAGNSILGMIVKGFIVRDLCRILCTSLKEACESFKCNISKGELNHNEIQDCFIANESFDVPLVRDYVIRDCVSLGELYFKCRQEFKYLVSIDIERHNTIASMSYKSFQNVCELGHYEYPIVDSTRNDIMRASIYGGRSQIFASCEVKDREIESIDCVSLYPYAMINNPYPVGQCILTDKYVEGKIGVYQCIIVKQPSRNIIPLRTKHEPLNWTYQESFECSLNSVDIEMVRKHGGVVDVIVGYYWEEKRDDIFEYYFRSIIKEKYQQDGYKESKDAQYNNALRECCKLLMNALSGKLQQRTFDDIIELIRNNDDLNNFNKKVHNNTETFTPLGNWFIAKGTKINVRPKMPTIWGSLILSYARACMYDTVLSKIETIFGTDTDSAFIYRSDVPNELIGTKLGQFKEEISKDVYEDESGPFGVFVAPKCYCFYKISKEGQEIPVKMRFKGVNAKRDKVVTNADDIIKMNTKQLHDAYWNSGKTIDINTFRQLLHNDVYILCSSLEKKVTDRIMNSLKISQRFALKKINKSNIEGEIIQIN